MGTKVVTDYATIAMMRGWISPAQVTYHVKQATAMMNLQHMSGLTAEQIGHAMRTGVWSLEELYRFYLAWGKLPLDIGEGEEG